MSINCLVISKNENSSGYSQKFTHTLYIEDYLKVVNVADARKLVDKIFLENKDFIAEYDYFGYKITWSWYDDIFKYCSNCQTNPN